MTTNDEPRSALDALNEEQRQAAASPAKTTLVNAGPGSGKTRVFAARVKWLLEKGVKPEQIVCITYTRDAARELRNRIGDVKLGACSTLHSWLLSLLRKHGERIGMPAKLSVIDEELSKLMLASSIVQLRWKGSKVEVEQALIEMPKLIGTNTPMVGARVVAAEHHLRLLKSGFVDYDSVLIYGLKLLKSMPELRFDHLLVDEFQDSSRIDGMIYDAVQAEHKFYVGDPEQAIFGFRGGSLDVMLELQRRPDTRCLSLSNNYRSRASICSAASDLTSHGPLGRKQINPIREEGSVRVVHSETEIQMLNQIAIEVEECGHEMSDNGAQAAVICRYNWQVKFVTEFLRAFGMKVEERKKASTPHDWTRARRIVTFASDPENDVLAFGMLVDRVGPKTATRLRYEAAGKGISLNHHAIHFSAGTLQELPNALQAVGVSSESAFLVLALIEELGPEESLDELALAMAEEENKQAEAGVDGGVVIKTIHGAKGREWDRVFVPWLCDELFPGAAEGEELAEMRRLFFVALTRAKDEVWLGIPKLARTHGLAARPEEMSPSRFLYEISLAQSND